MIKRNVRLALLGIAAALTVCGCSSGSSAEAEAEDSAVQTIEAAISAEQAVETFESEHPIAQDMPTWIGDETPIEEGFVGASPSPDGDDWFARNMPVIIYDAEPNGEGGLVPTTVVDPDGEGGLVPTTVIDPDSDDSFETETPESEND